MEATETTTEPINEPTQDASSSGEGTLDIQEGLKKLRAEVDNLNLDLAVEKARTWVKEHPVLATGAALGIGLIAASIVISMLEEEEEASRAERISRRVRQQLHDAGQNLGHHTSDLRQSLGHHADVVGERFTDSVESFVNDDRVADILSRGSTAKTSIIETVKEAAAAAVVQKVTDWIKRHTK